MKEIIINILKRLVIGIILVITIIINFVLWDRITNFYWFCEIGPYLKIPQLPGISNPYDNPYCYNQIVYMLLFFTIPLLHGITLMLLGIYTKLFIKATLQINKGLLHTKQNSILFFTPVIMYLLTHPYSPILYLYQIMNYKRVSIYFLNQPSIFINSIIFIAAIILFIKVSREHTQ